MTPAITLQKREDLRIRAGHLWVFSNEIREVAGDPQPGSLVEVRDAGGAFIGSGMYNPHSLIAARILTHDESLRGRETPGREFFNDRIGRALELRKLLFPSSDTYRLAHGESDLLPGLVIDRYNEYCSIQTVSLGMDACLPWIVETLEDLLRPAGIIERNDTPLRDLEGLPRQKKILRGTAGTTEFEEDGVRCLVNPLEGQKTGFYLDQRINRAAIGRFTKDRAVLDCFCNEGGFALHAAQAGAKTIRAVDTSAAAIEQGGRNAALNAFAAPIEWLQEDVFEHLEHATQEGTKYDMVILDPPSFTRSRKNVPAAKQGYRQLHAKAFSLLPTGGILATASCSHHIYEETFLETILDGARKAGTTVSLLDWRGASPDHPVLPAMPETKYLKFGIFCVIEQRQERSELPL